MFTEPEIPLAGLAGVGTLVTSMREMLLIDTCMKSNWREAPLREALAREAPSVVTFVMLGSKPRTETPSGMTSE